MAQPKHQTKVTPYDWPLGERWRWDCQDCDRGSYGFHSRESAEEYAAQHPAEAIRRAAMFARADAALKAHQA